MQYYLIDDVFSNRYKIGIKWYASILQPNPNSNISFITKTKWEQNSTNKWEDKHNDYKVLLQTKKKPACIFPFMC